jgi:hypothetical protein
MTARMGASGLSVFDGARENMSETRWTEQAKFSALEVGEMFVSTDHHVCAKMREKEAVVLLPKGSAFRGTMRIYDNPDAMVAKLIVQWDDGHVAVLRTAINATKIAEELEHDADNVSDEIVNGWLKPHGFSAMNGTMNGRALVRFLMRRTMAHVAAPIVAEQRGIIDGLRKERDEHKAPPESQVRAVAPSLQDIVPFFDEQIDVQALLSEAAKAHAHEQDRPCAGGEPQMIDRLAHIIRTYRGMETRDAAVRIGVAPIGQPIAQNNTGTYENELLDVRAILRAGGFDPAYAPTTIAINRLVQAYKLRGKTINELKQQSASSDATITRLAEDADRLARELAQSREQDAVRDEKLDKVTRALGEVQAFLDECSVHGTTTVERVRKAVQISKDIVLNHGDARTYLDEIHAKGDSLRERIRNTVSDLRRECDECKYALDRAIKELDAIRSVVLSIGGTFAAHNTPNVDVIQMLAKEHTELADIRKRVHADAEPGDVAKRVQELVENARTEELDNGEDSGEQGVSMQTESPFTTCWCAGPRLDIRVSLPLLRGLTAIIAEPMRGGHPSILVRRQRIIRMYRAILVLASTHGVLLDEHANDDLTEDGPVFDR